MNSSETELPAQVIDTWRISVRVGLFALDETDAEALGAADLKGRAPGRQFAHIHNVRRMWLEHTEPDLFARVAKLENDDALDKATLRTALFTSGEAVEEMLRRALAAGRIKGFKPHPAAFVGYLVAHEAFHLGDIGVRLTVAGRPLSQKASYGLWEWGVR